MSELTMKIEVAEALVLKPGDRVLVKLSVDDAGPRVAEDVQLAQSKLKEAFPDVEFFWLVGDVEIVHQPVNHRERGELG